MYLKEDLKKILLILEVKRKEAKVKLKKTQAYLFVFIIIPLTLLVLFLVYHNTLFLIFSFLSLGLILVLRIGYRNIFIQKITKDFKVNVFKYLLTIIMPDAKYRINQPIKTSVVKSKGLFEQKMNYNRSLLEDCFYGSRGKASYLFSEFHLGYDDGDHYKKMFKGVFFELKLNKSCNGILKIFSKEAREANRTDLYQISSENMVVDQQFDFFASKDKAVFDFVDQDFLFSLKNILHDFSDSVYILIEDDLVNIVVENKVNLFEPNVEVEFTLLQVKKISMQITNCLMLVDLVNMLHQINRKEYSKHLN